MSREVDFAAKPIDPDFMNKPDEYPETGEHLGHKVFAEGKERLDADGNPYPTRLGVHGTHVALTRYTSTSNRTRPHGSNGNCPP